MIISAYQVIGLIKENNASGFAERLVWAGGNVPACLAAARKHVEVHRMSAYADCHNTTTKFEWDPKDGVVERWTRPRKD